MRFVPIACLVVAALTAGRPSRASDQADRAFLRGQYDASARLYLEEAQRGRPLAQTHLGYQYQFGLGAPQSYEEAARWYDCAAEQGEPNAQFYLGQLFDRGQGVAEDPVEAGKWLDLAAAHAPAGRGEYWRSMRDLIAAKMTLDELSQARQRAVAWQPSFDCEAVSQSQTLQLPTKKYSGRESDGER